MDLDDRRDSIAKNMSRWRRIFEQGVEHQIRLSRDPAYRYPYPKYVECNGGYKKILEYKKPAHWWYEEDGSVYLQLNIGERAWVQKGRNPVIHVGEMGKLVPTLEKIRTLAREGKYDDVIERMVVISQR